LLRRITKICRLLYGKKNRIGKCLYQIITLLKCFLDIVKKGKYGETIIL
jgi:hypothetical protein